MKKQEFDLEVKVQGHRPLSMVHDTLSLGDLPTCLISKANIVRPNSYRLDMSLSVENRNLTLRSKFKVISDIPARDIFSVGDLPTGKILNAYIKRQKSYNLDKICYRRTE